MHATANVSPSITTINPSFVPVAQVRAGQHFIRTSSPSEVLVLLTYAGAAAPDGESVWAVVVATNHDSNGYVPGQLVKLPRSSHVRLVHETRAPVFTLER